MELDSIFTILAAVAIGLFQLVLLVNKKRREQGGGGMRQGAPLARSTLGAETYADRNVFGEEDEEAREGVTAPLVYRRMLRPEEEGGPVSAPVAPFKTSKEEEDLLAETAIENEELPFDFTAQKAILFSEVINSRWNSC